MYFLLQLNGVMLLCLNILLTLAISAQPVQQKVLLNGDVFYCPIAQLTPGQLRYSKLNTEIKLKKLKESSAYNSCSFTLLSTKQAIPIVAGPDFMLVVIDGHHEIMASLLDHKEQVPVYVKHDFSSLTVELFWQELKERNLIYPYDCTGKEHDLSEKTWQDLQNDPNRTFVSLCCLRLKERTTSLAQAESRALKNSYAVKHPLWLKIEQDKDEVPFIDMKLADMLYRNGFIYDELRYGIKPLGTTIEQARKILKKELQDVMLPGLIFNPLTHEITQEHLELLLNSTN